MPRGRTKILQHCLLKMNPPDRNRTIVLQFPFHKGHPEGPCDQMLSNNAATQLLQMTKKKNILVFNKTCSEMQQPKPRHYSSYFWESHSVNKHTHTIFHTFLNADRICKNGLSRKDLQLGDALCAAQLWDNELPDWDWIIETRYPSPFPTSVTPKAD